MFDFETSVTGIEFKVRQLADEVARLRTLVSEKEDECRELKEALNDKEIQEIAFNRYGFRIGLSGGQYDVKAIGVDGLPQEITSVVPGLKMDTYNLIIEGLKEVEF